MLHKKLKQTCLGSAPGIENRARLRPVEAVVCGRIGLQSGESSDQSKHACPPTDGGANSGHRFLCAHSCSHLCICISAELTPAVSVGAAWRGRLSPRGEALRCRRSERLLSSAHCQHRDFKRSRLSSCLWQLSGDAAILKSCSCGRTNRRTLDCPKAEAQVQLIVLQPLVCDHSWAPRVPAWRRTRKTSAALCRASNGP